ncbi:putative oligomerization/nucleic acid binding protein [Arcicella aurantiaca]|uniref:Putative oligomerization/nucleic acid binding protein n=1 Tax=Arcicella aurantiaca TaxID=591202 RepID=A0A316E8X9_9BACT|nr:SHOCT domain-containing protein [Arcicella aurantiaca]PWK27213.1 putative oligomerization/nucleic acid binding protein [Arcicella aurantiaca]
MIYLSWFVFTILVGILGTYRKIGGAGAFFLSLFLSPLIGVIFTLASEKLTDIAYKESMLKSVDEAKKANNLTDLEKLHELKEKGILTEEEYQEKKNKILGSN